jgi:hypothetical protein
LSLLLFYLLYTFRSLDDSRFSSWADVFNVVKPALTGAILIAALLAALVASRLDIFDKAPAWALFLLSYAAGACFWHEPEMIVDASRYFTYAKHLELYGVGYFLREWGNSINVWTDLPAVPFFFGIIFRVFGESRVFIQAFTTLLFSGAVVLTYFTGRELWNRETGLHAALLLLGIPYLYTQVPLMLVDVPSMFFLMLSVWTFLLALRRGRGMIAAASLSIFIVFFTKYSTWLMLSVLPVIFAVELFKNRRLEPGRYVLRGALVFFGSCLLISLLAALIYDEMLRQIHLLIAYQSPGLKRWGESMAATYFFQMHPVIPALATASVYAALRKRDAAFVIVAWLVIIMLALQIKRIRYLVMIFPMVCLMASYGLMQFRDRVRIRLVSFSVVAYSLTIALGGFLLFLENTSAVNIREAAKYLDSRNVHAVRVATPIPGEYVMNPAVFVPLLDLYSGAEISYSYAQSDYPLPADFETSPLRFTWTYKNPSYYQKGSAAGDRRAVAIITDRAETEFIPGLRTGPEGRSGLKVFNVMDNVFRSQTIVTLRE